MNGNLEVKALDLINILLNWGQGWKVIATKSLSQYPVWAISLSKSKMGHELLKKCPEASILLEEYRELILWIQDLLHKTQTFRLKMIFSLSFKLKVMTPLNNNQPLTIMSLILERELGVVGSLKQNPNLFKCLKRTCACSSEAQARICFHRPSHWNCEE